MQELLWLLLPLAAASGWYAARRSVRRTRRPSLQLENGYFAGLNYLLNEQPDRAIDVFVQMLEVNPDTVETHLALGMLFRRRGEVDRAIHVHQNLIARPVLTRAQRGQALLELALDYMRAGLLDRAEGLFKELLSQGLHQKTALRQLLLIFQQEKEWDQAIETARRLERETREPAGELVAQFCCERALQARGEGDHQGSLRWLKRALREDPRCARASLMEGDWARERQDWAAARSAYQRVEHQDAELVPETLEPMRHCYEAERQADKFSDYLQALARRHDGERVTLLLAEQRLSRGGAEAAVATLEAGLKGRPTLRGLVRLIELTAAAGPSAGQAGRLTMLAEVARRTLDAQPGYLCRKCGFTGRQLHWQCPGCKSWSTVKPIQNTMGEQW